MRTAKHLSRAQTDDTSASTRMVPTLSDFSRIGRRTRSEFRERSTSFGLSVVSSGNVRPSRLHEAKGVPSGENRRAPTMALLCESVARVHFGDLDVLKQQGRRAIVRGDVGHRDHFVDERCAGHPVVVHREGRACECQAQSTREQHRERQLPREGLSVDLVVDVRGHGCLPQSVRAAAGASSEPLVRHPPGPGSPRTEVGSPR